MCGDYVRDREIEDRVVANGTCTLRGAEHEADATCIKERQLGTSAEQEGEAKNVTIEPQGGVNVADGYGDLTDRR
jgi:hypothetical protein